MRDPRASRPATRRARAPAKDVQSPVRHHVAARVDGFLEVMEGPPPERRPVREKVERGLRRLHPMD